MALLSSVTLLGGCATADRERFATLNTYMIGSFSSEAQAAEDAENFFDIRLHMVPIWPARATETTRWLYVEQAAAAAIARPYRQRVYRLELNTDGTITSHVYELPGDPLTFAGAWKTPERFESVKPEELLEREGCAITLRAEEKEGQTVFVGTTDGTGCTSTLRGAAYATSEATISASGLLTWDRGYDAKGVQVWGATKSGYRFERVGEGM